MEFFFAYDLTLKSHKALRQGKEKRNSPGVAKKKKIFFQVASVAIVLL
jgi:hypothetical protein